MKNVSRRDFFKMFRDHAQDHTPPSKFDSRIEAEPRDDFPLGHLSEFPPGAERSFSCRGGCLVVSSSGEGLRAEWRCGEVVSHFPLRLQKGGELAVDLDRVCNRNSVFSLMTGEMTEKD